MMERADRIAPFVVSPPRRDASRGRSHGDIYHEEEEPEISSSFRLCATRRRNASKICDMHV